MTPPPARPTRTGSSPIAWVVALGLAAMVGTLLFVGGYLAAGGASGSCVAPSEAFAPFCDAYAKLKAQYVDQLDDSKLAEGAIQGMFEHGVQDPFSGYMSPEDYQRALGDLSGQFSGIGAEMGVRNLDNPDGPGSVHELQRDLRAGGGCALGGLTGRKGGPQGGRFRDRHRRRERQRTLAGGRGQAGPRRVGHGGDAVAARDDRPLEMTITRANITTREVTSRMLDNHIGYVALHGFSNPSSTQFHEAIAELLGDGATSFVFDLRDNPGGYIDAANKIASEFIKSGLVFTQESAADGVKRWEATGDGLATDPKIPVVVLVNNGSASASEIVSAALKERGRATIIGQHTYGKNTVQLWDPLDNGGGVRITISRWFTPDHHSVAPDGVQPDIVVNVPDGTPPDQDLFLDRAVQFLTDRALGEDGSQPQASSPAPSPAGMVPTTSPVSYDPRARRWRRSDGPPLHSVAMGC